MKILKKTDPYWVECIKCKNVQLNNRVNGIERCNICDFCKWHNVDDKICISNNTGDAYMISKYNNKLIKVYENKEVEDAGDRKHKRSDNKEPTKKVFRDKHNK